MGLEIKILDLGDIELTAEIQAWLGEHSEADQEPLPA